jgi:hypothetical protein
MNNLAIVKEQSISSLIYLVRGEKVMLDFDLANLYGVETRRLKEQVRRNINRFPEDFMFQLTNEEFRILRSQIATSSWGGSRYRHMAFTEQGVAMLSSVLNSERAISVNIQIIRVFIRMRKIIESHKDILKKLESLEKKDIELDEKVSLIFEYLKELEQAKTEEKDFSKRKRIGFRTSQVELLLILL